MSIATTSNWKDKSTGEKKTESEWHRIVLYNRLAEIANQYLKKGALVYIEGRLKTRKWQDKETGQDRYATDIVGDQMQMLSVRDSTQESPSETQTQRVTEPEPASTELPPSFENFDDDLPF